jgi:hypothetical protein
MLTTAGYVGLAIMLTGIVLVIIGVIFYEIQLTSNKPIQWWVWLLLSLGGVMTVAGLIVTLIFLKHPPPSKS